MKNKNSQKSGFTRSNEIMELEEFHAMQAKNLINKLKQKDEKNVFIEIDCIPNGSLNAFNYGNGLESAKIIYDLAGSFLATDRAWLSEKIHLAKNSEFELNVQLGEEAGLWKKINPERINEELNWDKPFCVKNEKGITKIWHPDWRRLGYNNGFSTRSSIMNFIYAGGVYLQKFYMPLRTPERSPAWRMHYRLVFFAKAGKQNLELIGGLWISRPGYKIYLDKNSTVGLVSPITTADAFI